MFLGVLLISMFPLVFVAYKQIKTPSATMMCTGMLIVLAVVFSLMYYAEESTRLGLMVVSITAASSNIISTILFKLSAMWDELFKHCGEVYVNNG
jgi:glucose-6-phosphate-specific signal transduction histidine kinase